MIEKSLIIIIFMYCASFGLLTFQYVIGDVFHVYYTNQDGQVLSNTQIITWLNNDTINQIVGTTVTGDYSANTTFYNKIETFTTAAAFVAWNLVTILTGTYVFNILQFMGLPQIFVVGIVFIYILFLIRAIVGYVRGL